jgi:hypothetical protein
MPNPDPTPCFVQEAVRLSQDTAGNIDGVDYWVNAGAIAVTNHNVRSMYRELLGVNDGTELGFYANTYYDENNERALTRTEAVFFGNHEGFPRRTKREEDMAKSFLGFHELAIKLSEGVRAISVYTTVNLSPVSTNSTNTKAHIDIPLRETTDHNIGKITLISAFPNPTLFLADGHRFKGKQAQLFDVMGSLHDESGLAGKLKTFRDDDIVLFGGRSTVHCEPLHAPEQYEELMPRMVARSIIEFSLE